MEEILLNSNKSKESVLVDNYIGVELKQDTRVMPFNSVIDRLDAYKVYERERDNNNKYRLIFTVNNVCSNVLFNMLTEIVKDEGTNEVSMLNKTAIPQRPVGTINTASLDRKLGVKNTEYSNKNIGYKYFCGVDIFNNHLIRSKVFKSVNKPTTGNTVTNAPNFNTIADTLRLNDGSEVQLYDYKSGGTITTGITKPMHLYINDDISTFAESYRDNLQEKDGWVGFNNVSKIKTFSDIGDTITGVNINKVINYESSCSFIDMYPDRTLYSFVPKTNKFRNRLEYNWKYDLTYPFSSTTKTGPVSAQTDNSLVTFRMGNDTLNGLAIVSSVVVTNSNGVKVVMFRCVNKHNLKIGSLIRLYYGPSTDNMSGSLSNLISVIGLGDLSNKDKEHCFYVGADNLDNYGLIIPYVGEGQDVNIPMGEVVPHKLRFVKVENGLDCQYYFRVFKKIPNFKLTDIDPNSDNINELVKESEITDVRKPFDNSVNKLAFAKNIYGDDIVQIVFTDDINVGGLVDNLGRPLSEIYLTIVKNNKGYKEWYANSGNTLYDENGDVEYSHAFGKITTGLNLPITSFDSTANGYYNVKYLTNVDGFEKKSTALEEDITIDRDTFLGDLVEFSPGNVRETVLETVHHRFNTAQRETTNVNYQTLYYDDLIYDDYDIPRNVQPTPRPPEDYTGNFLVHEEEVKNANLCPEGYYYKPHFRIPLKEFAGTLSNAIKPALTITDVPSSTGYELVVKTLSPHALAKDDVLSFVDVVNNKESDAVYGKVTQVSDIITFSVRFDKAVSYNKDASIIRVETVDIPSYAINVKDGSGRYLWREFLKPGTWNSTVPEYPFTNGAKYIHENINFFVKRQDPLGLSGLREIPDGLNGIVTPVLGTKFDITPFEYYTETENPLC
jgi:hypothetical protein